MHRTCCTVHLPLPIHTFAYMWPQRLLPVMRLPLVGTDTSPCALGSQATIFGSLDRAEMTVWEALAMLNELREYEAVLMAEAGEAQVGKRLAADRTGKHWFIAMPPNNLVAIAPPRE